jgi:hypothetical protein
MLSLACFRHAFPIVTKEPNDMVFGHQNQHEGKNCAYLNWPYEGDGQH